MFLVVIVKFEKRLVRLSREFSRKVRGRRLQRHHKRVSNIRLDFLHKTTTSIANRYGVVGIEGLCVKGMLKNGHLSKSISDASFGKFRVLLTGKMAERGSLSGLIVASMTFPSSKTYNVCGTKTKFVSSLWVREWDCLVCGSHHDRDMNASINLKNNAVRNTVSACGQLLPLKRFE